MSAIELSLKRQYFPTGTNGVLEGPTGYISQTIELPWLENERRVSCVSEGRYRLIKRYTKKRGWHLLLLNVQDRDLILIHAANWALQELKGCIAPVMTVASPGVGWESQKALKKLRDLVFPELDKGNEVWLTIMNKGSLYAVA